MRAYETKRGLPAGKARSREGYPVSYFPALSLPLHVSHISDHRLQIEFQIPDAVDIDLDIFFYALEVAPDIVHCFRRDHFIFP